VVVNFAFALHCYHCPCTQNCHHVYNQSPHTVHSALTYVFARSWPPHSKQKIAQQIEAAYIHASPLSAQMELEITTINHLFQPPM
jgi:hypothetical protein